MVNSNSTDRACIICEKPGALDCGRCKSSRYCSGECQRSDWPVHKLLCASFSRFDITTRPSKTHFRGFFFPQDQTKPQVVWLDCPWRHDEDEGVKYQYPDLKPFLGPKSSPSVIPILIDAILQRHLPDTIHISYRDTFLIDGSKPNQSVEAVLATMPGRAHDWRGPIVTVGKEGLDMDPNNCRDLTMNDFRYIADYLISYNRWPLHIETPIVRSTGAVTKGVRINCLGDRKIFNKLHYEPVDVPSTDPIFNDFWHLTSDIADRVGIPILTLRCPVSLQWATMDKLDGFGSASPYDNKGATYLHLCCDPKADNSSSGPSWAWADRQWQKFVGSVIVVRRDEQPLLPIHIEALCTYSQYEVGPLMGHSIGDYAPDEPLTREAVLQMICRPTFSIFWVKFCRQKSMEGVEVSAPSPYEPVSI